MMTQTLQPYVSTSEEKRRYFLGLPTILRATGQTTNGGSASSSRSCLQDLRPRTTHHLEDEAFYVIHGEMAFVCDGTWTKAGPGTFVFGPRNIPHGFTVLGDEPARMLLLCAPGGFDRLVVEMSESEPAPPDMAKLMTFAAKAKVERHGPLPELPTAMV